MSNKKDKSNKDLTPDKLKELRQAYLKEGQIYKERVMPLVQFLRNKQLRFNNANIGQDRVEYFRLDEFQKLIQENKDHIEANQKLNNLVKNYSNELVYFKRPESIKIKYPKTLEPVPQNHPQKKYASFRFDTTESKKGMTILVIFLILALVLFPIWPYNLKYGIWLVSLVILIFLVGIIILRLIIYLLFSIFNYHIWIFPNLFYSTGILDSFIPVLQINKGDRSWFNLFLRLFAISAFILLTMHIYLNPTFLDQNIQITQETILDLHDWGVAKLKKEGNFSQRALTNLEKILNQTSDVQKQQAYEFQGLNVEENIDLNDGNSDEFQGASEGDSTEFGGSAQQNEI